LWAIALAVFISCQCYWIVSGKRLHYILASIMSMLMTLVVRASTPSQGDVSKDVETYGPFVSVASFYMAYFPFEKRRSNRAPLQADEEAANGGNNNDNAHQLQDFMAGDPDAEENMDEPDAAAAAVVVVAEPVDNNADALHNPAQLEEPESTMANIVVFTGNGDNCPEPNQDDANPTSPSQQPRPPRRPERNHASRI